MQDSQADGNIVMDGNGNLIWKEGELNFTAIRLLWALS